MNHELDFPAGIWEAFAKSRPPVRCSPGYLIYLQDTEATCFYFLKSGRVKSFIQSEDGGERLLCGRFPGAQFACVGRDGLLSVYVSPPSGEAAEGAADYLAAQTRLPRGAFRVCPVEDIPRTEAGKTCYARLNGDG